MTYVLCPTCLAGERPGWRWAYCQACDDTGYVEEDAAQVGRSAKRHDPQGRGPKDEHAVLSEAKDAPKGTSNG